MKQELSISRKNKENTKLKLFAIFKLIMSIIYFVPAFFSFGLGLIINIILLIVGAGGSKLQDTSSFISGIGYISIFSIIPAILVVILFIIAIISSIKTFKNKYNKKLDFTLCILFIIVNILLMIFLFNLSYLFLTILLLISTIIILMNIYVITKI